MIGKVSPRGERVTGLIYYLFGPGRSAEHTDPHIVAGWRHPAELEPPVRADGHHHRSHEPAAVPSPAQSAGSKQARPRPRGLAKVSCYGTRRRRV